MDFMGNKIRKSAAVHTFAVAMVLLCSHPAVADHCAQFDTGCKQMQVKHFQDAISSFTESIALTPGDSMAMFRRGQAFYCLAKYDDALADFDRAVKIDKDVPSYYVWRGTAQAKLGADQFAIRDYQKAMRLDPALVLNYKAGPAKTSGLTAPDGSSALSGSSSKKKDDTVDLGHNDRAMDDYAEAVRRSATPVTAFLRAGTVFSGVCEISDDGSPLECRLDSQKDGTLSKREGADYFELNDDGSDKALRGLDNDVDAHPEDAKLYYSRARVRQQMGWLEMANSDYDRAIELDKSNATYRLARAFLYHQQQKDGLASKDIEAAINLDPDLPETILFTPPAKSAAK